MNIYKMTAFGGEPEKQFIRDVSYLQIKPKPIQGSQPKVYLEGDSHEYILKLPEIRQNGKIIPYHVSEFVSCSIVRSLGYSVQDVEYVIYKSRIGTLVTFFSKQLITFPGLGSSTLDHENLNYDLDVLYELFESNKFNSDTENYLWNTFLLDSLLNNLDRHPNNWGFYRENDEYKPAPLIDFGNSLYSINAQSLGRMIDINAYMDKYGMSVIKWQGTRANFKEIILNEKNTKFYECLHKFIKKLDNIDLKSLNIVEYNEPIYKDYCEFVRKFVAIQVIWFKDLSHNIKG